LWIADCRSRIEISALCHLPSTIRNFFGGVSINSGFNRGGGWQRRDNRGPSVRVNERIRAKEIRVIGDEGEQLGVMTPYEAIKIARERGLDLVEVAAQALPPVCRIIDFGKYQYEQKKKAHEAKKKQVVIEVKEIKFRPGTDDHDYNFKMKHAKEILQDGNKVKATVRFRGREITHKELGMKLINRLEQDLLECGAMEVRPRVEGMMMTAIFAPKKVDKPQEKPKPKPPAATAPPKPAAPKAAEPNPAAPESAVAEAAPLVASSKESAA
jgi:translation initiation factor IF-3